MPWHDHPQSSSTIIRERYLPWEWNRLGLRSQTSETQSFPSILEWTTHQKSNHKNLKKIILFHYRLQKTSKAYKYCSRVPWCQMTQKEPTESRKEVLIGSEGKLSCSYERMRWLTTKQQLSCAVPSCYKTMIFNSSLSGIKNLR